NASSRMRVTAANPRLATGLRAPSAESAVEFILGRCRQACRKPCLKAQFCVKSRRVVRVFDVPAVVLLFPAVMTEPTNQRGGKGLRIQRGNPEPRHVRKRIRVQWFPLPACRGGN